MEVTLPGTGGSRIETRRVDSLRSHPALAKHGVAPSIAKVASLADAGEAAFRVPLLINQHDHVLEGYERLELARLLKRSELLCFIVEVSEEDSIRQLLRAHKQFAEINAFNRISLALELKPALSEMSKARQQAGGQLKGSSKVTKADRLDVRKEIAAVAAVSSGNVTKVEKVRASAPSDVIAALQRGELSIHKAFLWSQLSPAQQSAALSEWQNFKGFTKLIDDLLTKHPSDHPKGRFQGQSLIEGLVLLDPTERSQINVQVIERNGSRVLLTQDIAHLLESKQANMQPRQGAIEWASRTL